MNGKLQSYSILPSTLWQQKTSDFLYMPGHPLMIAASYRLFGVGAFQSILPSLVSYLVAILCIYLIGARCYSPHSGVTAAILFALFPPILFLAFTAMSELTLLAAFTAAICLWIYLPPPLKPWLGPCCVALSFLFRETSAFVIPALGLYLWFENPRKLWRPIAVVGLSLILLTVLYRADFSANRPSLLSANTFGDWHAIYDDAEAQQAASNVTVRDWIKVIPVRALKNIGTLIYNRDFAPWAVGGNYVVTASMILVGLIALLYKDKWAYSLSALNLVTLTAAVSLVNISGYRAVRYLMFTYALNIVVIAPHLIRPRPHLRKRLRTVAVGAVAAGVSISTLEPVRSVYKYLETKHLINRGGVPGFTISFYAITIAVIAYLIVRRRRAKVSPRLTVDSPINLSTVLHSRRVLMILALFAVLLLSGVGDYPSRAYLVLAYTVSVLCLVWLLGRLNVGILSRHSIPSITVTCAMFLFSLAVVRNMYRFFAAQDATDTAYAVSLESIGHDNSRMLATPFDVSIRYRYDHFPLPWSFTPYNEETLKLLTARFDVATLVVEDDAPLLRNESNFINLGFYKDRTLMIGDRKYVVFKRATRDG